MSPTLNPLTWFPGYKTYMVAISAMLTAVAAFIGGDMALGQFVEAMFAGVMAMTLRKGMK